METHLGREERGRRWFNCRLILCRFCGVFPSEEGQANEIIAGKEDIF
jgi:hypothetical protein